MCAQLIVSADVLACSKCSVNRQVFGSLDYFIFRDVEISVLKKLHVSLTLREECCLV